MNLRILVVGGLGWVCLPGQIPNTPTSEPLLSPELWLEVHGVTLPVQRVSPKSYPISDHYSPDTDTRLNLVTGNDGLGRNC